MEYSEWLSQYGTYLVIWYGPSGRLAGNLLSGTFSAWPSQALTTYVVLGLGSVLYRPVIFGVSVYALRFTAVS